MTHTITNDTPDTPEEVAENFLGLLRNIVSYTDSWHSFLPAEMRVSAMLCAGVDVTNREFGPGKGAAIIVQFLTEMIRREPAVIRHMTGQLTELNTTILAEQARMAKSPVKSSNPGSDPEKMPSAEAIEDLRIQLYCVKDSAMNMLDHLGDKTKTEHSVADILDDLDEAHKMLNKLEPRKPKRKAKLN
jgi:hypothetical protein